MRSFMVVPAALGLLLAMGCGAPKGVSFGEKMTVLPKRTVQVASVIAEPTKYEGHRIRVEGTVDSVCAHKGCWIRMAGKPGGETLFIKFTCPVDGRLIPMAAVGKKAVVEGELEIKMIPEDEARHYAEDSGKSKEEIAKIVGPQKTLKLNSPAAVVMGLPAAGEEVTK